MNAPARTASQSHPLHSRRGSYRIAGHMSRPGLQGRRSLVILSLFLALLANFGLTVHTGHHSLLMPHSYTETQLLADHSEPDSTLHLESVSEVRTLLCPGCLLQQQIGGTYLAAQWGQDQPALARARAEGSVAGPATRTSTAQLTRGPPLLSVRLNP